MAPQHVKPYVPRNKNDARHAEGNQIRGLVAEYGLVAPKSCRGCVVRYRAGYR